MKSSQQTRPTTKSENTNPKCPCPIKQGFTRKGDRTPLGDIQDPGKNQHLSEERAKSVKSESLTHFSSGCSFGPIQAESTRIKLETPVFKQPLLKLPAPLTVHPKSQKTESETSSISVRSKSSSYKACRCTGAKSVALVSNKKENARFSTDKLIDLCESSDDDIIFQPTSARTSLSKQSPSSEIRKYVQVNEFQFQEPQELSLAYNNRLNTGRSTCKTPSDHGQSVKLTSIVQNSASHSKRPSSMPLAPSRDSSIPISNTKIHTQNSTSKKIQNSTALKKIQGCCSASSTAKTSSFQQSLLSQNQKYVPQSQSQFQEAHELNLAHNKKVSTGRSTCKTPNYHGQSVKITSIDQNSASHGKRPSSMPSTPSRGSSIPISNTKINTQNSTSKCSASSTAETSSFQQYLHSQNQKYVPESQSQFQKAHDLNLANNKKVSTGRSACKIRSDHEHSAQISSSGDQNSASRNIRRSMPLPLSQVGSILSETKQSIQDNEDFVPWIDPNILSASNYTSKTFQNSAVSKDKQSCCSAKSTAKTSSSQQPLLSQKHKYLPETQSQHQEAQVLNLSHNKKVSTYRSTIQNQGSISNSKTDESIENCNFENVAAGKENQGCWSESCTSKTDRSPVKYAMPSQQFVTLFEDTAKTIIIDCDSLLSKIRPALDKVKVVRDSSLFSEEEKTFVDGPEFFEDLDQGKCSAVKTMPIHSPLSINVPLRRSTSLSESDSTKRVKTTLRRTSSIKKVIVYPLLYSSEYIEDIISYAYKQRKKFLLMPELIDAYVDKRYRTITINWLLQVTELIIPDLNNSVYYTAVRIFDYSVIKLGLRKSNYRLAAIVAFWISLKYLDNSVLLKIPKIFSLCSGKYSKEEILSLERNMLKSINFCLSMSHPLDFLNYYLRYASLENNEVLRYGAKFVMECATLFETYATNVAPLIAASALYLAHKVLRNTRNIYANFIWFDPRQVQKFAESVLLTNVQYAIINQYEPWNKYSTPDKLKVANEFGKTIEN